MTTDDIERRLRFAAPDEPAVLPPLVLPIRVGTAPLSDRTIDLRLGRRRRTLPLVLVAGVLLLVGALVGALLVGALRLEQLRDALPVPGLYAGRGITIDYPDEWERFTPNDPLGSNAAAISLIVGNRAVSGCEPDSEAVARNSPPPQPAPSADGVTYVGEQQGAISDVNDRIYACLIERPLAPGEVRLVVSRDRPQAIGVGPVGDFAGTWLPPNPEMGAPVLVNAESGFTDTVGQMPAQLIVRDRSVVPEAEQLRTWLVAIPRNADSLWWIQAVMRGPDVAALEAEVDAVARSVTFDEVPAALDEADLDGALAKAVDSIDRAMREYPGRRFLGCLPRTPGSANATIVDAPAGRLREPLDVTCTTAASANDLRVWQGDLEVSWPAAADHPSGSWAERILFDSDGLVVMESHSGTDSPDPVVFPGDPSVAPSTGARPSFAPGDLARSVGAGAATSFENIDTSKLPPEPHLFPEPGATVVIVSGPEVIDGRDFYFADAGTETGWTGVEANGHPVLVPANALCPSTIDATELAYLSALERRRCVSGEVTLAPVHAARVPLEPSDIVEASPAWLASDPQWALYGVAGSEGLDPGLPVVLAPELESLPTDGWLSVRGHFDDPASAACRVTYPADMPQYAIPPAAQHRRCQERFVVTGVTATEAP